MCRHGWVTEMQKDVQTDEEKLSVHSSCIFISASIIRDYVLKERPLVIEERNAQREQRMKETPF